MTKYTRRETIEAEQWNKPGDLPRVVIAASKDSWVIPWSKIVPHKSNSVRSGDWIRKHPATDRRGVKYEAISGAKFKAQGWKEAKG